MVYGEHLQRSQIELAEKICKFAPTGMDMIYLLTTGAEANDAALKAAVKATRRNILCAFTGGYHGDTIGALACFGSEAFRRDFQPILTTTRFSRFGDVDALQNIDTDTAAVLVEPVQGEAGIYPGSVEFLTALRDRCSATGTMLIFDEIQTGFGRTGEWFAANLYGIAPDLITVAKGMGAGLPLAGVIGEREMLCRFASEPSFSHITTFGGNPVSCAAGLAAMQIIEEEGLLQNCIQMGKLLLELLQALVARHSIIRSVRGVGLMIGIELESESKARKLVNSCKDAGLII
jgi:acetylornithine/succinyldiaminopimelate/putrescine aminotransferase